MFTETNNVNFDLSSLLQTLPVPFPQQNEENFDTAAWPWSPDELLAASPFRSFLPLSGPVESSPQMSVNFAHPRPVRAWNVPDQQAACDVRNQDPLLLELLAPAGSKKSPTPILHTHRRLPNTDDKTLDSWLYPCDISDSRIYRCAWPNCPVEPFRGKSKARIHVRKHLGITKLYECTVCYKQFVCQGTAKRHTDTQQKALPCPTCGVGFARKDALRVHERRCAKRHMMDLHGGAAG